MDNSRTKDASGFIAFEWVLGIVLLVIPSFILAVSFLQYPTYKTLSQNAASESAKAYVQAANQSDAQAAAKAAAKSVIDTELPKNKLTTTDADMDKIVKVTTPTLYCPGAEVTITITIPMPLLINPFSSTSDSGIHLNDAKSSATERIDDYRELESDPACP